LLQGREQGARLDTLYGSDVGTLAVVRHHQTRQAWFSVDLYGAARACAHVAASLRACEPDVVANYVEEQCMLIDSTSPLPAVNGQAKQLWVEANVLGSVLHDEQDSITDMTVAQDTMMCLGIGVAANLGINSTGPLKLQAQKVIRNGFLASWLPFTAALLLAWPDWSWWYWSGVEDRIGLALVLAVVLEVGAFFLGRRVARGLSPSAIGRMLVGVGLLYICLLVLPWQWYSQVGTASQFRSGAATPLWRHGALLVTLVVGGAWMFSVLGLTVAKLWRLGTISLSLLLCSPLFLSACGPSDADVFEVHAARVSSKQSAELESRKKEPLVLAVSYDAEAITRGWVSAQQKDLATVLPELVVRDEGQTITALIDGRVDAAILHRPPNDAEERYSRGEGLVARTTLHWETLARCAVVLLVHAENPISSVPVDRALEMLSGEVRDWAQVGDFEGQVHLFAGERSASSYVAAQALLDGTPFSERLQTMPSDRGVAKAVASDPLGLGLGSSSSVEGVRTLAIVGSDGKRRMHLPEDPDRFNTMLSRSLYLVTRGVPGPGATSLRDYAVSKSGVAIAELNRYVVEQGQ